jgi:hypothetical protein
MADAAGAAALARQLAGAALGSEPAPPPPLASAEAQEEEHAAAALPPACAALTLPAALLLHVFTLLPVETRLRCREVCTAWRDTLSDHSAWTRLDLACSTSGALLRCTAGMARGRLQALVVAAGMPQEALLAVALANRRSLCELRVQRADESDAFASLTELLPLLHAAPALRELHAEVHVCDVEEAHRVLRNEGALAPLRVRRLRVVRDPAAATASLDDAAARALAEDVAAHAQLRELELVNASLRARGVRDVLLSPEHACRSLRALRLVRCGVGPEAAPTLARLLRHGALQEFYIEAGLHEPLLDDAAAATLGDALRDNATLTELALHFTELWSTPAACAALLGALTGHASVACLSLMYNHAGAEQVAAGTSLGALVAANARALTKLDVSLCGLGDEGMTPLLRALPGNTHLRSLVCADAGMSADALRDMLLPAVAANASLRFLSLEEDGPHALQAEALVARRSAVCVSR